MQKFKVSHTGCLTFLLLAYMLVMPTCVLSASLNVSLVLSNNSAPYQEFASAFNRKVANVAQVAVFDSPQEYSSNHGHPDIVVAVGMAATELVMADASVPVLAAMVPQPAYEDLLKKRSHHGKVVSVIYLNQPWERQIDFLFATLPHTQKVGVLHTIATQTEVREIGARVKRHGGKLVTKENSSPSALSDDLDDLLHQSDVLLAVPDSAIYSAGNIRNILLSTYRQNVPLLGWSQAFVNAGAVAALFATPEQIANQTAGVVLSMQQSASIAPTQYPNEFNIAINRQVSRSLRLEIPSESEIRARMMRGKNRDDE